MSNSHRSKCLQAIFQTLQSRSQWVLQIVINSLVDLVKYTSCDIIPGERAQVGVVDAEHCKDESCDRATEDGQYSENDFPMAFEWDYRSLPTSSPPYLRVDRFEQLPH